MTLATMLAAHDPATLESLASKGLVRRASKQANAADIAIEAVYEERATVVSEGHTIDIDASGPAKANCSCPATGICRHILTAVLVLRDQTNDSSEPEKKLSTAGEADSAAPDVAKTKDVSVPTTALDTLLQLTLEQLKKFAGADWEEATQIAAKLMTETPPPAITVQGLNSVVVLDDGLCSITFIAGQHLKEVAYKGPKTKQRLYTTVCALLLRQQQGIALEVAEATSNVQHLNADYLAEAKTTLESAAVIVLSGAAEMAAEQLFDLAISARVQVAPRLSSQLRSLSNQALKAKAHAIDFHASEFLGLLARTYALVRALEKSPDDTALSGSLQREYLPTDALDLWVMGAKHWMTPSGARGVTAYAYSEQQQRWYTSTVARAAGMHLSFDPYYAYQEALWGGYSMSGVMGKRVELASPRVSKDQQIAPSQDMAVVEKQDYLDGEFLQQSSSVIREWSVFYARVKSDFGAGLTRAVLPVAQLVKPERFGALTFDEFAQTYYWELLDIHGQLIELEIPASYGQQVEELRFLEKRIEAVLLEAAVFNEALQLKPVSVLVREKQQLQVLNIQFNNLWNHRYFDRLLKRFKDKVLPARKPRLVVQDPLSRLADDCIECLVDWVAYPHNTASDIDRLQQRCEAGGLATLADAMRAVASGSKPDQVLAAVYIASEVSILSGFDTHFNGSNHRS